MNRIELDQLEDKILDLMQEVEKAGGTWQFSFSVKDFLSANSGGDIFASVGLAKFMLENCEKMVKETYE